MQDNIWKIIDGTSPLENYSSRVTTQWQMYIYYITDTLHTHTSMLQFNLYIKGNICC